MGEVFGQVISLGIGVALNPIAIIAVVLLLARPDGRSAGLAFLAGWMLGLAMVGTLALLIADGANAQDGNEPAVWASVLKIALGVLLLAAAAQQWSKRPADGEQLGLPAWMAKLDGFTPRQAARMAVALAAVNPKSVILVVGAAVAIAEAGVSAGKQAVALCAFVAIGSLGPGIPVAINVSMPDRAAGILDRLRHWMTRNNATIIAAICLVLATVLIGGAIRDLSA